jgi:hypothetical protein
MKKTLGWQFYFFQARRGVPTLKWREQGKPASRILTDENAS